MLKDLFIYIIYRKEVTEEQARVEMELLGAFAIVTLSRENRLQTAAALMLSSLSAPSLSQFLSKRSAFSYPIAQYCRSIFTSLPAG